MLGLYLKSVSEHPQITPEELDRCTEAHEYVLELPKLTLPGQVEINVGPPLPAEGTFDIMTRGMQLGALSLKIYSTRYVDVGYGTDHQTEAILEYGPGDASSIDFADPAQVDYLLRHLGEWVDRAKEILDADEPVAISVYRD